MLLTICHKTDYRYARPVQLQPHRLMLCPRGNYDLRLLTTQLSCSPPAKLEWTQDVFGNLIATATFSDLADRLTIDSRMEVEHCAAAWPVFSIAPSAHAYPFRYSADEMIDLSALLVPRSDADGDPVRSWAESLVAAGPADTLSLLQAINAAVHGAVSYRRREEEGTQPAHQTLTTASGSCRDIATLFIEAVRSIGFAARAVSGYLYACEPDDTAADQHGATHAWAEVYLPAAGWIAFDPTNARMGNAGLVPVAVARGIEQILPVVGSYAGAPGDFLDMRVEVEVCVATARPSEHAR